MKCCVDGCFQEACYIVGKHPEDGYKRAPGYVYCIVHVEQRIGELQDLAWKEANGL